MKPRNVAITLLVYLACVLLAAFLSLVFTGCHPYPFSSIKAQIVQELLDEKKITAEDAVVLLMREETFPNIHYVPYPVYPAVPAQPYNPLWPPIHVTYSSAPAIMID